MHIEITEDMKEKACTSLTAQNDTQENEFHLLGKYACMELLELDWQENLSQKYFELDDTKVYVKTDIVPDEYHTVILSGDSEDDDPYALREFTAEEFSKLENYNLVIFGLFVEEDMNSWHPIGYLSTKKILGNFANDLTVPSGELKPIMDLM